MREGRNGEGRETQDGMERVERKEGDTMKSLSSFFEEKLRDIERFNPEGNRSRDYAAYDRVMGCLRALGLLDKHIPGEVFMLIASTIEEATNKDPSKGPGSNIIFQDHGKILTLLTSIRELAS